MRSYSIGNQFSTCNSASSNPYFTYCLSGAPLPFNPSQPQTIGGSIVKYNDINQPLITSTGADPRFKFDGTIVDYKNFEFTIQNYDNGAPATIWTNNLTGEVLPTATYSVKVKSVNSAAIPYLLNICTPSNGNLIFTSKEQLQREKWEYTLDGNNWIDITQNPDIFQLNQFSDHYEIKATNGIASQIDISTLQLRCRLKIDGVNQDNTQQCLNEDFISYRANFYIDGPGIQTTLDGPEKVCWNNFSEIKVNNPETVQPITDDDWSVTMPDGNPYPYSLDYNENTHILHFTPLQEGTYHFYLNVNALCGDYGEVLVKTYIVKKPDQVEYELIPLGSCPQSPVLVKASGGCNYRWYRGSAGTTYVTGGVDEILIYPEEYQGDYLRLIGEDCFNRCASDVYINFNFTPQPKLILKPICKTQSENPYEIELYLEDGITKFQNDASFEPTLSIINGGIVQNLSGNFIQNDGGQLTIPLLPLPENSEISTYYLTVRNEALEICQTIKFNVFKKDNISRIGNIDFEGLTFVCGLSNFKRGGAYSDAETLNLNIRKDSKLYFIHNEVGFTEFNPDRYLNNFYKPVTLNNIPDKKVQWRLDDGVNLNIEEGAFLTSECKMWLGVSLTNGGNNTVKENLYCRIGELNKTQVKIHNAYVGIRVISSINSAIPGTVFVVQNTNFFNNMIGVMYEGNAKYDLNNIRQQSKFRYNVFDSDSKTMLPPFHPQILTFPIYDSDGNSTGNITKNIEFVSQNHFLYSGYSIYGASQKASGSVCLVKSTPEMNGYSIFHNNSFSNCMEAVSIRASKNENYNGKPSNTDRGIYLEQAHNNTFQNCFGHAIGYFAWEMGFVTPSTAFRSELCHGSNIQDLNLVLPKLEEGNPILNGKIYFPNPLKVGLWDLGLGHNTRSGNPNLNTYGINYQQEYLVVSNVNISGQADVDVNSVGIRGTFKSMFLESADWTDEDRLRRVNNCTFTNLGTGLREVGHQYLDFEFYDAVTITKTKFIGCFTGIDIPSTTGGVTVLDDISGNFTCNYFSPGNIPGRNYIGINIGVNAPRFKALGLDQTTNSFQLQGNAFPVRSGINRSIFPIYNGQLLNVNNFWQSPTNWKSVVNSTTNNLGYYSLGNEFIGSFQGLLNNVRNVNRLGYTSANIVTSSLGPEYVQVCALSGWPFEVIFPIAQYSQANEMPCNKKLPTIQISVEGNKYVAFTTSNDLFKTYSLSDLTGKLIVKGDEINQSSFEFPADNLVTGIYLLHCVTKMGDISVTKLIVK